MQRPLLILALALLAAPAATALAQAGPAPCPATPCVEDDQTLCLNGSRFRVKGFFDTVNDADTLLEPMGAERLTGDTGYLYFKNPDNVEVILKVLDACPTAYDRFWVFVAGLTDVRVEVEVCDTQAGVLRSYGNPQTTPFQPIQDTDAFATCP